MIENLQKLSEIKMFEKCKITNNQLKLQGKRTRRGKENKEYREMRDFYSFYMKINELDFSFTSKFPLELLYLHESGYQTKNEV